MKSSFHLGHVNVGKYSQKITHAITAIIQKPAIFLIITIALSVECG